MGYVGMTRRFVCMCMLCVVSVCPVDVACYCLYECCISVSWPCHVCVYVVRWYHHIHPLLSLAARARQAGRTVSARDEDTYDAAANAHAAAESSESENEEDIDERDQREQLRKERAREIKREWD